MSNLVAPSRTRPWYMMSHPRSGRNPFDSTGLDYCLFCKREVDTDTEAHWKNDTYVFRRQCCRCGQVINWGVYNQVSLLTPGPLPAVQLAYDWVTERGEDRS